MDYICISCASKSEFVMKLLNKLAIPPHWFSSHHSMIVTSHLNSLPDGISAGYLHCPSFQDETAFIEFNCTNKEYKVEIMTAERAKRLGRARGSKAWQDYCNEEIAKNSLEQNH
jgi:hypothetical protein